MTERNCNITIRHWHPGKINTSLEHGTVLVCNSFEWQRIELSSAIDTARGEGLNVMILQQGIGNYELDVYLDNATFRQT